MTTSERMVWRGAARCALNAEGRPSGNSSAICRRKPAFLLVDCYVSRVVEQCCQRFALSDDSCLANKHDVFFWFWEKRNFWKTIGLLLQDKKKKYFTTASFLSLLM